MNRQRLAEAALVWNTVIWGATFVVVKAALDGVSPILFLALRFSLAFGLLVAIFRRSAWPSREKRRSWKALAAGGFAGIFLFCGYLFQTIGLRFTTAPRSAFLTGLSTVTVPLLAALVYRTRPQVSEVVGVLVATGGMALMTLEGTVWRIGWGDLLTVFCAVAFAAHIVVLGHFSESMSFELLSVAQIGTAALLSLSLFWWAETPHVDWRPAVVYGILITGIFATALAFTIQAWAQRHTSSTRTALIYTLEPVVALITSYLIAGEGLSGRGAAGAALILGGVVLVEMKPLASRQHPLERRQPETAAVRLNAEEQENP